MSVAEELTFHLEDFDGPLELLLALVAKHKMDLDNIPIRELNDQIQATKAQLVSEQSQYTYYNSTLNSKTNIASVEETAGRLGLMKVDPSQITYIRLGESGALVRRESTVRQWTDFLYTGAVNILGTVR